MDLITDRAYDLENAVSTMAKGGTVEVATATKSCLVTHTHTHTFFNSRRHLVSDQGCRQTHNRDYPYFAHGLCLCDDLCCRGKNAFNNGCRNPCGTITGTTQETKTATSAANTAQQETPCIWLPHHMTAALASDWSWKMNVTQTPLLEDMLGNRTAAVQAEDQRQQHIELLQT